jgi:hypothetical protein
MTYAVEFGRGSSMAKYGLFSGSVQEPFQTFEGDRMAQNGDHVYIFRKRAEASAGASAGAEDQVAAIKLGEGQCVKEMK